MTSKPIMQTHTNTHFYAKELDQRKKPEIPVLSDAEGKQTNKHKIEEESCTKLFQPKTSPTYACIKNTNCTRKKRKARNINGQI